MTADEIISRGTLVFPNGRRIEVDSLYKGQVCYRLFNVDSDDPAWLRAPIAWFIEQVQMHGGERAVEPPG